MTDAARVVLQDAKFAIGRHENTLQAEAFRLNWLSIVTALRAVGHVLDKVDGERSAAMRQAVDEKWRQLNESKPEPQIFWRFINEERNRFLKNYEHGISRTLTVPAATEGFLVRVDGGRARGGEFAPGTPYDSFIASGPYGGERERDIAWDAHDWWETYLHEVDDIARQYDRR